MDVVDLSYLVGGWWLRLWGFRSRKVPTASGRVHLFDAVGRGTLPPVLVLHGVSASAAQYAPVLRRLRRWSRRVIAVDAPGHGFSDRPPDWDPQQLQLGMLEALEQVLDEPVVVYGNSMGGYGAIRLALERPELVRGLVLTSPAGAPMTAAALRDFIGRFAFRSARDAVVFLDRLYGERKWLTRWIASSVVHQMGRVFPLLERLTPEHLLSAEDLARLEAPILLQWGAKDRLMPPEHLAFFRSHLPPHRFEAPETFGHCPNLDRPGELAGRIRAFLEGL